MTAPALSEPAAAIRVVPLRTPTLPPATHTNTYVVGAGDLAVIDPGSPWPEEQAALARALDDLLAAGVGRVREILLTHHHVDHVSGAAALAERLGVPIAAHPVTAAMLRDHVRVDRLLDEGEPLRYGPARLDPIFTPGHAPGHLVFVERSSGAVLVGDMIASVGTIIVDPPEGEMRLYLASLERLRALGARLLLPAHGPPVDDPEALLSFYVAHRLEREARVVAALAVGAAPLEALLPRAYPDVAPLLHPLAARSLLAHLLKLRDDGRAVDEDGRWRATA